MMYIVILSRKNAKTEIRIDNLRIALISIRMAFPSLICEFQTAFQFVNCIPSRGGDISVTDLWPLLLTWFNFNPSMDK